LGDEILNMEEKKKLTNSIEEIKKIEKSMKD
jgi:hypothetical protein